VRRCIFSDGNGWRIRIKIDKPLLFVFFTLLGIGIVLQYSANYPGDQTFFIKHLIWIGISLPFGFIIYLYPLKKIRYLSSVFYIIGILLLIIVLFLPHSRGRWIELGGFQFQPSELMKVFYIMFLARIFTRLSHKDVYFPHLVMPILYTLLPVLLIFFEPDIGTSAIFIIIFFGMVGTLDIPLPRYFLYISPLLSLLCGFNLISWIIFMVLLIGALLFANIKFRDGLLLFLLDVLLGSLAPKLRGLLKPYQKDRLMSFINPSWDPTGAGWHILQSKISIGSGGFFGKGYLNGIIKNLGFLPQTRTDFIFAVLGEEFGFLGTLILLLLFAYFLIKVLLLAENITEPFKKYLTYGIFFYFSSQIIVNIGMTIGLLPVVGLPLPFISYGGTSMLVSIIFMGYLFAMRKGAYA